MAANDQTESPDVPVQALFDEDGEPLGVPPFVQTDTVERWLACQLIATAMTKLPPGDPENQFAASYLFNKALPGSERDISPGDMARLAQAARDDGNTELAEALVSAAERAGAVRHQWRNRLGRWIDMPDGMLSPGTPKKITVPEMKSPGTLYTPEDIRKAGLDRWPVKSRLAEEILGLARNTAEKFRDPEHTSRLGPHVVAYHRGREQLHQEIVSALFAGKAKPQGRRPRVLFTAGGTAAGKTSVVDANPELGPPPDTTIRIDPDDIKEEFPEYQKLHAAGDHYAASAVHDESGDVAAKAFLRALNEGYDIRLDGTGDGDPGEFVALLEQARDHGYDVDIVYVNSPTDVAIARAIKRADEKGRYVPVPRIREIHAAVSRTFTNEVINLPWIRALDVFDQGDHIATWHDGALVPFDRKRLVAFAAKQEEVPGGA